MLISLTSLLISLHLENKFHWKLLASRNPPTKQHDLFALLAKKEFIHTLTRFS